MASGIMAPVKFMIVSADKLATVDVIPGQYMLVFNPTTRENEYICYDDTYGRHIIRDVVDLPHDSDRQTIVPSTTKFYYAVDANCVYRYLNDAWVRISSAFVVQCASKMDLPPVGDEHTVYFIKSQNQTYYWDPDDLAYYCAGSDWHDIELIDSNFTE